MQLFIQMLEVHTNLTIIYAYKLDVNFAVWHIVMKGMFFAENTLGPVLDFGPEHGSTKGTMADLGPLGS